MDDSVETNFGSSKANKPIKSLAAMIDSDDDIVEIVNLDDSSAERGIARSSSNQINHSNKNMSKHFTNDVDDDISVKSDEKNDKTIKWTYKEYLYLVHFVQKIGREWTLIAKNYKTYFNNRTNINLCNKYDYLEKHKSLLEDLKNKSKSLKQIESNKRDSIIENNKYITWNEEETVYLVIGVKTYGKNWRLILEKYNKYFKNERIPIDLSMKYYRLVNNKTKFKYFSKKANLLLKKI